MVAVHFKSVKEFFGQKKRHCSCDIQKKKSESLQTEGRHFRSMIYKLSDV